MRVWPRFGPFGPFGQGRNDMHQQCSRSGNVFGLFRRVLLYCYQRPNTQSCSMWPMLAARMRKAGFWCRAVGHGLCQCRAAVVVALLSVVGRDTCGVCLRDSIGRSLWACWTCLLRVSDLPGCSCLQHWWWTPRSECLVRFPARLGGHRNLWGWGLWTQSVAVRRLVRW